MVNRVNEPGVQLTRTERNANAFRALIKLLPSVGDALDQLAFGPLDERRWKRVEKTLEEVAERLERRDERSADAEEYANLIESALPKIARATSEDTRARFSDLLTNAATVPTGDDRWGQAELAEQLLSELAEPALAVLAGLARRGLDATSEIVSLPKPQVVPEGFNWNAPVLGEIQIPYRWPVIGEWVNRLGGKRLLFYTTSGARGGFGGVHLTDLGVMLVEWTVTNEQPGQSPPGS